MKEPVIITVESAGDSHTEEFAEFVERTACAAIFAPVAWSPADVTRIRAASSLGSYIEQGTARDEPTQLEIRVELPPPTREAHFRLRGEAFRFAWAAGWDWSAVLQWIGMGLTVGCAAGGSRALVGLLKAWVAERKGRKIKIRKGTTALEISGAVSTAKVDQIVDIFEKRLQKSSVRHPRSKPSNKRIQPTAPRGRRG